MYIGGYNDYELLYLIHENSYEALGIMFHKYQKLIYSKIYKYKFPSDLFDDLVQEGNLILYKAINIFNDKFNKTFTKFLELLLENRFIDLYKKFHKTYFVKCEDYKFDYEFEKIDYLDDLLLKEDETINYNNLSNKEKEIYSLKYIKNLSVNEIHKLTKYDKSSISNTIQRIKRKMINN
mgnify:CR=1 FL=1